MSDSSEHFESTGKRPVSPSIEELKLSADANAEAQTPLPPLPPFEPPSTFDHGEEFELPVPRPIPKFLRQGSHAQRKKGTIYSLIALGIMFVIFSPIPFVQGLSFYILPLQWLHWIGFGLIGLGCWVFIANLVSSGKYTYVKSGEPFVGRVLDCQKVDTGTPDVPSFRHLARIEFQHPDSGQQMILDFPEPDNWSTSKLNQMSCTLRRGDYLTLVRLPGKGDASSVVYGFLGLDPEREFILKNGQPLRGTSPFTAIMIAFLIAFVVLLVMALFDVLMFSFPVSGDWKLPTALAVGGFLCGGLLGGANWKKSNAVGKSAGQMPSFIGFGFLGAIVFPLVLVILNSRLDVAPTSFEPIEIVEFWNTTHNFVIRDYEIEYRELQNGNTTKQHMRFTKITSLYGSRYAVLELSPGRFGYAWIKGIHPIRWIPEAEADLDEPLFEVHLTTPNSENVEAEPDVLKLVPTILLENGRQASVPELLLELDVKHLESQPNVASIQLLSGGESE